MFLQGLQAVRYDRIVVYMEQLDRDASERVLRAMAQAGVDLDDLVAGTGIGRSTLMRRLTNGPWKLIELAKIAQVIGCPAMDLMPTKAAA
jgi:hypothetical protein